MNKALTLVFLCGWFCGYGQAPDWVWARSAATNSNGGGEGNSIATDQSNNVYVTGYYANTIAFGSHILTSNNMAASYLTKYDLSGNVLWAKNAVNSASSYSTAISVCTDISGDVYITGYFLGTVSFGAHTLVNPGNMNVFLVKYDSSGNVLWARSAGGTSLDEGFGVSTDRSGNIYVTGYFNSPTITFGSYTLSNAGTSDIFLAKYDSSGNVLWAKSAGGNSNDEGYSVATDSSANVYVTGFFNSSTITFGSNTLNSAGVYDIFLAKYDSSGNVLWAKSAGGTNSDFGCYVAADSSGDAYITGYYSSPSISFGSHTLVNAGAYNVFLTKYDSSGNVSWAKSIGGSADDRGYCVTTDRSDRIYMTGSFTSASLTFDTITVPLPAINPDPMFVAAYDSAGDAQWAKALGSGGDDRNAVAASPSGCIYIGGDFEPIGTFIIGNDSLNLSGGENVFVAKLCNNSLTSSFTASDNTVCAEGNNCINFTDYSGGNPTSWQWSFPGGIPSSSTLQNPTNICYSAPGTYPVTLIVGNGTTSDTLTVASMIIVGGTPPLPVVSVLGGDTLVSSQAAHYQWYLNGNVISGATDSFYVEHQNGTYSVQITDAYGCTSLSNGMIITSVDYIEYEGIEVYPNPADNQLAIGSWQLAKGATIGVYGVLGEEVLALQSEINNPKSEMRVNVSTLSEGIYFLKINLHDKTIMKRIVICH